ncbi:uncharacterized protein [Mytilus edulis]|uniref:uncharacterized protein n=1 Tax=Mytilus edulis TaxID=6550 RepID=UPI0039EEA7D3
MSSDSCLHAAYAVPLILAVGFIVIFVAVRKYCFDSKKVETNKESRCLNPKKLDYTPVSDKNNTAQDVVSEVNSNGKNMIKENKSSFRNNEVKTVDTSQNKPSLIDIYDVPSDTVSDGIVKDRGKNKDHGVSDQDAIYSEVFNQVNMKSEISKARTSVLLDNVDHDGVCVEQCHV